MSLPLPTIRRHHSSCGKPIPYTSSTRLNGRRGCFASKAPSTGLMSWFRSLPLRALDASCAKWLAKLRCGLLNPRVCTVKVTYPGSNACSTHVPCEVRLAGFREKQPPTTTRPHCFGHRTSPFQMFASRISTLRESKIDDGSAAPTPRHDSRLQAAIVRVAD